jgi:acylglycerol lipase
VKIIFLALLSGSVVMNAAPFSFKEVNAIETVDLATPEFLKASDGIQLAHYNFSDAADEKIVILYAGAGLYGNKSYQWVAKALQEKYGIGCYIFDIRGHGHSEGSRGDASSIERVLLDVTEAISFVKTKHPHAKVYLAGHSSGAGLIINYAANTRQKLEDGYIFLAPYLGPKSDTARVHKNSADSFIKRVRIWVYILGSIFPNSFVAHSKAVFFNYPDAILQADPLIVPFYTFIMSMATTPYEVNTLMQKIDKPVGIFIGNNDEQFLPEKVIAYKDLIHASVHAEIVENAGHLSILLEAPRLIAAYLKDLQK